MRQIKPFGLRLPPDAKAWVEQQAKKHKSSQNAEIVRAVRERMDRTTKVSLDSAEAPTNL